METDTLLSRLVDGRLLTWSIMFDWNCNMKQVTILSENMLYHIALVA